MERTLIAAIKGGTVVVLLCRAIEWVFANPITILNGFVAAAVFAVPVHYALAWEYSSSTAQMRQQIDELNSVTYEPKGSVVVATFNNMSRFDMTGVALTCGSQISSDTVTVPADTNARIAFSFASPVGSDCVFTYQPLDRLKRRKDGTLSL